MAWLHAYSMSWMMIGFFAISISNSGRTMADFSFGAPTNLGSRINTVWYEACPRISADGLTLYFGSDRPAGLGGWDLWIARRETVSADWDPPMNLGAPVNSAYEEVFPELCNGGLTLYFASSRPGGYGWLDIYVTTRPTLDAPWEQPVNLGPVINDVNAQDGHSLSADGLTMYFISGANWPGSVGGYDLWVSTRQTLSAPWGTPVNLGPTVNSAADDYTTDLSPDGLVMFFQSLRAGGHGSTDLYVMQRNAIDALFGLPVNLGWPVNTASDEGTPNISADGSTLYFHSNRPGTLGKWDLWQAPILPEVDFSGDGFVGLADLRTMCNSWLMNDASCDVGPMAWGDGIIDIRDFAVLADHWGTDVGLIGHWELDETEGATAHDHVGEHDGTLLGEPQWQPANGAFEGALALDGVNDFIYIPFVLDPSEVFSIFLSVKTDTVGKTIASQRGTGGASWLAIDAEGRLITELQGSGRGAAPLPPGTVITDNQWHQVGFTWDGEYRTLYVDGVEVRKDTTPQGIASATGGLHIGADKTQTVGSYFLGLIDDVRIYNRAITP